MGLLKFRKIKKTKVEEQIDTMQSTIAFDLRKVERLFQAIIDVVDVNKKIEQADLMSIYNNAQHGLYITKNLASDLERDARL